jgi:ribulose-phosphate 3-epimerase
MPGPEMARTANSGQELIRCSDTICFFAKVRSSFNKDITVKPLIAPSILSADFARLGEDVAAVLEAGADVVHFDVMDNHFVPNLTFGPLLVAAARKLTTAFIDVHLMMQHPQRMVAGFRKAGADQITIHVEAQHDDGVAKALATIRDSGARVGLALKPGTGLDAAEPFIDELDLLLVMTVEPGFGGQAFMADQLPKVEQARALRDRRGAGYRIEVDGGIAPDTARQCLAAGADAFVAGSAVFGAGNPAAALAALRSAIRRTP